jgi:hypothetical protein
MNFLMHGVVLQIRVFGPALPDVSRETVVADLRLRRASI